MAGNGNGLNLGHLVSALSDGRKEDISNVIKEYRLVEKIESQHHETMANLTDDSYKALRTKYSELATLTALCQHPGLNDIISHWSELQLAYIAHVKDKLKEENEILLQERDGAYTPEIDKLEKEKQELTEEWARISKDATAVPSISVLEKLLANKKRIEQLKPLYDDLKRIKTALGAVANVQGELNRILDLPPHETINYVLLSAKEIIGSLKAGTYKGIPFKPFTLYGKNGITRSIEAAVVPEVEEVSKGAAETGETRAPVLDIRVPSNDIAPDLVALLALKDLIDNYSPGTILTSAKVREDLEKKYGNKFPVDSEVFNIKIVGNYLRDNLNAFGLKETDKIYVLAKLEREPLTREQFLAQVYPNIRAQDSSRISRHYITKALAMIRVDPDISHDTFTAEQVRKKLLEYGCTVIDRRTIGINLGVKFAEEYGIKEREELKDGTTRYYEFTQVIPTDSDREKAGAGVSAIGTRPFTLEELTAQINQHGKRTLHPKIVGYLLETEHNRYGLSRVETDHGITYQSKVRPETAAAMLDGDKPKADMARTV
ncbi:TPA: hypothetical protein HA246_07185 [Candidatus Woesearchaeota archaeon]|nr:hypothetical protein [Candidatus Woesearchaeota archaeon]